MVRKSLRRALALGTGRGARDGAAIRAACLEPVHGADAGSGKWLSWHFPLLGRHAVPSVPALDHDCRDTGPPWDACRGHSPGARGWNEAARPGPCLSGCPDAGLSSCPCFLPALLWGCGHCPLAEPGEGESISFFSPARGGHPEVQRNPWSWARILPFQCQVLHVGIVV